MPHAAIPDHLVVVFLVPEARSLGCREDMCFNAHGTGCSGTGYSKGTPQPDTTSRHRGSPIHAVPTALLRSSSYMSYHCAHIRKT